MEQVIVYQNQEDGRLCVVAPCQDSGLSLEQIALKDVPHNVPYKIYNRSDLPQDFTFFDAWEMQVDNFDGSGANYGAGTNNHVIGWNYDGTPIIREEV